MNNPSFFPPDYFAARSRFREAAARLGWSSEAHPIEATGPDGEELTIDVAISPGVEPQRAVVVSSGLHGVEGFFGSAVQLAWLARQQANSRRPVRFVFVHALNPYGFARVRRYDEQNVDPNRNFLLPDERYEGSPPGYAELDPLLNPRRPPRRWDAFHLRAAVEVLRRGMPAMKRVIMTGQHDFPRGVFFAGAGPSRTNRILTDHLGRWIGGCREVVHLDFHTGLGPWATYKLLIDYAPTAAQSAKLSALFGADAIEICDPNGIAYSARGDFGRWCLNRRFAENYLFACAEFGTYGPITMLTGIRAENLAFQWGTPDSPSTLRAKARLKQLFCPAEPDWREKVLASGMELIDKAAGC